MPRIITLGSEGTGLPDGIGEFFGVLPDLTMILVTLVVFAFFVGGVAFVVNMTRDM